MTTFGWERDARGVRVSPRKTIVPTDVCKKEKNSKAMTSHVRKTRWNHPTKLDPDCIKNLSRVTSLLTSNEMKTAKEESWYSAITCKVLYVCMCISTLVMNPLDFFKWLLDRLVSCLIGCVGRLWRFSLKWDMRGKIRRQQQSSRQT